MASRRVLASLLRSSSSFRSAAKLESRNPRLPSPSPALRAAPFGDLLGRVAEYSTSAPEKPAAPSSFSEVLSVPEVEKILADVKADDVTVIPTHNHSCWADVTIIATGRSDWHLRNIAQALVYRAKQKQQGAKHVMLPSVQGYNSKWIVIDYGKFVVHALDEKARSYFNLETLWTTKKSDKDDSLQDLQNAFVKVRPINNSKKKPKPAKGTS